MPVRTAKGMLCVIAIGAMVVSLRVWEATPPEACMDARVTIVRDGHPFCLGVAIGLGTVLTAKHCVQDPDAVEPIPASRLIVRASGGRDRRVETVVATPGTYTSLGDVAGVDLAVLGVVGAPLHFTAIARAWPREGDPVYVSVASDRDWLHGAVRSISRREIFTEAITCEGESGAPAFDAMGLLVGIASWRTGRHCGEGQSSFVRLDAHATWLAEVVRSMPATTGRSHGGAMAR